MHDGLRFISVNDRDTWDFVHFWHNYDHYSHDQYKDITQPNMDNIEDFLSENKSASDSDENIVPLEIVKPK